MGTIQAIKKDLDRQSKQWQKNKEGKLYRVDVHDEDLADDDSLTMAFDTGDTEDHCILEMSSGDSVKLEIYEDVDWDSGSGTEKSIHSLNRQNPNTPDTQGDATGEMTEGEVVKNPDNLSTTDLIYQRHFFGRKTAAIDRRIYEIILAKNTKYAIILTALNGSNSGEIVLEFYEND